MLDDAPFRLENRPLYIKPATIKPPPEKQGVLFRGLGDSPNQRDFTEEIDNQDSPATNGSE